MIIATGMGELCLTGLFLVLPTVRSGSMTVSHTYLSVLLEQKDKVFLVSSVTLSTVSKTEYNYIDWFQSIKTNLYNADVYILLPNWIGSAFNTDNNSIIINITFWINSASINITLNRIIIKFKQRQHNRSSYFSCASFVSRSCRSLSRSANSLHVWTYTACLYCNVDIFNTSHC